MNLFLERSFEPCRKLFFIHADTGREESDQLVEVQALCMLEISDFATLFFNGTAFYVAAFIAHIERDLAMRIEHHFMSALRAFHIFSTFLSRTYIIYYYVEICKIIF